MYHSSSEEDEQPQSQVETKKLVKKKVVKEREKKEREKKERKEQQKKETEKVRKGSDVQKEKGSCSLVP